MIDRQQSSDLPYVRIEAVSKDFGGHIAVDNVSLDIHRGEIFCLLGGSGSGKTTLLRMLAGFEQPSAGRIFIDGADMAGVAAYERPVNMMFQSYALFPHMTVEQNVAYGLKQEGRPKEEIAGRVVEMLRIVKLTEFARRKPHQLSGGQRQRVALARALVKRPKLLLLDEPLGALDKKLREHTQFELLNLQEQLGVTFVVVTHDQEEAMTLASRIGVMHQGRIVQVGTPSEIYEFPKSRFVADFIGSVNLFAGRLLDRGEERVRVECPELGGAITVDHAVGAAPGAEVWVALRPEKILIERAQADKPSAALPGDNYVSGTVREVAYMGEMSVYIVQLAGGRTVRVTQPNISRRADGRISWDERVWLTWHPASAVVVKE